MGQMVSVRACKADTGQLSISGESGEWGGQWCRTRQRAQELVSVQGIVGSDYRVGQCRSKQRIFGKRSPDSSEHREQSWGLARKKLQRQWRGAGAELGGQYYIVQLHNVDTDTSTVHYLNTSLCSAAREFLPFNLLSPEFKEGGVGMASCVYQTQAGSTLSLPQQTAVLVVEQAGPHCRVDHPTHPAQPAAERQHSWHQLLYGLCVSVKFNSQANQRDR